MWTMEEDQNFISVLFIALFSKDFVSITRKYKIFFIFHFEKYVCIDPSPTF